MKFKIENIKQKGERMFVSLEMEDKSRRTFSMGIEMLKDDKYIDYIKERIKEKEEKEIKNKNIGKEFEV